MKRYEQILAFDTALTQGAAQVAPVHFWCFRYPAPIPWSAELHRNGLFAYGDRVDIVSALARRALKARLKEDKHELMAKQSGGLGRKSFREVGFEAEGDIAIYDFSNLLPASTFHNVAKRHYSLVRDRSLSLVVNSLHRFLQALKAEFGENPYGAHTRRVVVAFLIAGPGELESLNPSERAKLQEVFSESARYRLRPLLFTPTWSALAPYRPYGDFIFVEKKQESLLQEVFSDFTRVESFYGDKHVGLLYDKHRDQQLLSVSKIAHDREDWFIKKQELMKRQEADWDEYLSLLQRSRED